ncbi:hypothetical protein [Microvirga aerophila]|uniref:Uncharacterized protein n=1 Tax=Microvirga aerophila TaxID=670291 RepID=A0A512BX03_9HYPH|nr:hypothetical protein [Microvirga aerophila]GEO16476.1 hypothetical protein MAE02_41720 [Microvirga aerophila]
MLEETQILELVSLGTLGAKAKRPEIHEFLDGMPDQKLAYLAVQATRLVKRRLARGQGRGLWTNGVRRGRLPLDDALHRIIGELMAFMDPGETW